jgi:hypothetical protein
MTAARRLPAILVNVSQSSEALPVAAWMTVLGLGSYARGSIAATRTAGIGALQPMDDDAAYR